MTRTPHYTDDLVTDQYKRVAGLLYSGNQVLCAEVLDALGNQENITKIHNPPGISPDASPSVWFNAQRAVVLGILNDHIPGSR